VYRERCYRYFTGDGNFGIGTNAPSAKLHVNGSMRIVDGQQAAGKVLTSDASGNANWQTLVKESGNGFHVVCNADIPGSSSLGVLKFPSVFYNDGDPYDPVTGEYTAPANGFYHFDAMVAIDPSGSSLNSEFRIEFRRDGLFQAMSDRVTYTGQNQIYFKLSISCYMTAGTTMAVYSVTDAQATIEGNSSIFTGFKVY
jgi:hypothetical protein